jgi:hypothetical protein
MIHAAARIVSLGHVQTYHFTFSLDAVKTYPSGTSCKPINFYFQIPEDRFQRAVRCAIASMGTSAPGSHDAFFDFDYTLVSHHRPQSKWLQASIFKNFDIHTPSRLRGADCRDRGSAALGTILHRCCQGHPTVGAGSRRGYGKRQSRGLLHDL